MQVTQIMQVNACKSSASVSRVIIINMRFNKIRTQANIYFWMRWFPSEDMGSQKALIQHCQCPLCAHLTLALMSTIGDMTDMV